MMTLTIAGTSSENLTRYLACKICNLVPRAFLRQGEDGREKTLASADHVTNLNITFPTNLCFLIGFCHFPHKIFYRVRESFTERS